MASAMPLAGATSSSSSSSLTLVRVRAHPLADLKTAGSFLKLRDGRRCVGGRRLVVASSSSMEVQARFGFSTSLGSKGSAGVLERPTFDQSQFDPTTQVEEGGDIGRLKHRRGTGSGDSYKVLLLDDERHTEKLVVKVLPQAVPSVTPDDARKFFMESRENGLAVVITAVKEHAEFYSQMMVRGGLRSTIEPDSSTV